MQHVGIAGVCKLDAVDLQHIVDAVHEIERHRQRGHQRHHDGHCQGQPVVLLAGPRGAGELHPALEPLPEPGACGPPERQHDAGGGQIEEEIHGGEQAAEGIGGAIAGFREKEAHGAVDHQGVDRPPEEGHRCHPDPRPSEMPGGQIQKPRRQAEERAAAHAEDKAAQRISAEKGREELVCGHDIAGGGLPHAGKAEHRAHGGSLRRTGQRPCQQHRQIRGGDGDGLHMKISEKGKGHQQLCGDQRQQREPPRRAAGARVGSCHGRSTSSKRACADIGAATAEPSGRTAPFRGLLPRRAPGLSRCRAPGKICRRRRPAAADAAAGSHRLPVPGDPRHPADQIPGRGLQAAGIRRAQQDRELVSADAAEAEGIGKSRLHTVGGLFGTKSPHDGRSGH